MTDNTKTLDRVIRLGILEQIQENEDGLSPYSVADKLRNDAIEKVPNLKNVCCKMPAQQADQIDSVVQFLGISKRRFLEISIMAGVDRFHQIADQEGFDESFEQKSTFFALEDSENAHA